jgi:hypothetical protein
MAAMVPARPAASNAVLDVPMLVEEDSSKSTVPVLVETQSFDSGMFDAEPVSISRGPLTIFRF